MSLVFISNELQDPKEIQRANVPLTLISVGFIDGRMYTHYGAKEVFAVQNDVKQTWGNDVVYGGLYILQDPHYYLGILDAHHSCSYSSIGENHPLDLNHRHVVNVQPITFDTVDTFQRLRYAEDQEVVPAHVYYGNPKHPKIKSRYNTNHSYRIIEGLHKESFKELIKEVLDE